ncbi:MAG: chemotaxis protein CheW [Rickettsiales bacterium]
MHNKTQQTANENSSQYLTFKINHEEYGIDIMLIREIKAYIKPARLPNAPDYLLGVVNLRGVIIPVYDLKIRFGIKDSVNEKKKVMLFIACKEKTVCLLVDSVSDIIDVIATQIQPAPKMEGGVHDEYLNGLVNLTGRMVVLLDSEKIFSDESQLANEARSA